MRTLAYMPHGLRPEDILSAIDRLKSDATAAIEEVERYWEEADPGGDRNPVDWRTEWTPRDLKLTLDLMREGVVTIYFGSAGLTFYPSVAIVHFSARWRGFLTIDPLRRVHQRLAHRVAEVLGASSIIWMPDFFERRYDVVEKDGAIDDVRDALQLEWGPPQPSLDEISPHVLKDCEHCPPKVWYIEETSGVRN